MTEYHKIQSVFKRNMEGDRKLLLGQWTLPEFDYLKDCLWQFTEKVDGMNIRLIYDGGYGMKIAGRTDNAQIPPRLAEVLEGLLPRIRDGFYTGTPREVVLYGEGYGGKIQKGSKYRPDQNFVLFDVKVGRWWLNRETVDAIAKSLGIESVPVVGEGDLWDAIRMVRSGFRSMWGDFIAEGVVARPAVELQTRSGNRIITKVKHTDFS